MDIMFYFNQYWYVFVVALLILTSYGYSKLDVYTKRTLTKTFTKTRLIVIAVLVGWYFWSKYGSTTTTQTANIWVPVIFLMYLVGVNFIGKLRYETQQLLTPNFHGSYSKAPFYINGFYIFAIDSFNAGGIAWDYSERIAVIREETIELFLHGALSIAEMANVSKYELDDDVRKFIESNKFLKGSTEKIYYGWFDSIEKIDWDFKKLNALDDIKNKPDSIYNLLKKELGVNNPSVETLFWTYKNLCKAVNKQTEWYDATVETTEKGVEHQKRVRDTYAPNNDKHNVEGGHEESY